MSAVTIPAVTAADFRNHYAKGRELLVALFDWSERAHVLDGRYEQFVGEDGDPDLDISDGCGHGAMLGVFNDLEDLAKMFTRTSIGRDVAAELAQLRSDVLKRR